MLQDSRAVERNVVVAIGVFWAFLFKELKDIRNPRLAHAAWLIPVLFAVLGGIRSFSLQHKFGQLAEYIQRIEDYFGTSEAGKNLPGGWETFQAEPDEKQQRRKSYIVWSSRFFWIVLILTTIVAALIGPS
jgi:hypothetical protein